MPSWMPLAATIAIYALLSLAGNLTSWLHGAGQWLPCRGCGDTGQEVWFLASGAHAAAHLENPLRTTWINAPRGMDLADTTSMPLVGIASAPITWLFGPIATFNVVFSFSFFASATTAMLAAKRWVRWLPAAFVAGLLYGFSPYMVGQGYGHLFLLLTFAFPLMLIVLDEILARQRRPWWADGLALGALVVVQLGISVELIVDALILMVVGLVLLAATSWRAVPAKAPHALRALVLAGVVSLPALLWYYETTRTGPGHISGPIHSISLLSGLATNVLGTVLPTTSQVVNFGHSAWASSFVALTPASGTIVADVTENGAYLGIPLLLLLLGGLVLRRRDYVMRFFALMALVCFVVSLGPNLHVGNAAYHLAMPFRLFLHFSVLDNAIASRWSLFVWLFVSIMAALTLERCRYPERASRRHGAPVKRPLLAASLVLMATSVVSLVPPWPYAALSAAWVPAWFQSPAEQRVPEGSALLTYPVPSTNFAYPMMWQSIDYFRYRIPDGKAGLATSHFGPLERWLLLCFTDPTLKQPSPSSWTYARAELKRYRVETIVAPPVYPWFNRACAVRYFSGLLQRPPVVQAGADVWSHVEASLQRLPVASHP